MNKKFKILTVTILLAGGMLSSLDSTVIPDKPEVVFVEGGTFIMGTDAVTSSRTLNSFSIGKYPVTVGQYKKFCESTGRSMPNITPKWGWQDSHPMVYVSYFDAVAYCNWLSEKYGGYWHLPTEAEWEYAARGGNKTEKFNYSGSDNPDQVGWFKENAGQQTRSVGSKRPNGLGIYDMHGNIWEWCRDRYGSGGYHYRSPKNNPEGPDSSPVRVLRGDSWRNRQVTHGIFRRSYDQPLYGGDDVGFRVATSQMKNNSEGLKKVGLVKTGGEVDCQSCRPLSTLCSHIATHTPDEEYEFHYRRMFLEAACADPETDTDEEIFAKIRSVWDKCEDMLVCANTSFDTVHGNIIKFATAIHQNAFFDDVLRWGVNLNRVDPVDDMTVLDYVQDQIRIYRLEPGIVRKLNFYYSELRKAGAKHKLEL